MKLFDNFSTTLKASARQKGGSLNPRLTPRLQRNQVVPGSIGPGLKCLSSIFIALSIFFSTSLASCPSSEKTCCLYSSSSERNSPSKTCCSSKDAKPQEASVKEALASLPPANQAECCCSHNEVPIQSESDSLKLNLKLPEVNDETIEESSFTHFILEQTSLPPPEAHTFQHSRAPPQ